MILVERRPEWRTIGSRAWCFLAHVGTDRGAGVHQVVFIVIPVVPVASPNSPRHEGNARNDDGATDANHHTNDGLLGARAKS